MKDYKSELRCYIKDGVFYCKGQDFMKCKYFRQTDTKFACRCAYVSVESYCRNNDAQKECKEKE